MTTARRALTRRLTGYGAGSLIAATTAELAFVAVYGWAHAGTTWASAAGFVGGAVPNYVLNRRWAWPDRRGRDRRVEAALYAAVAVTSFLTAALTTHWVEAGARSLVAGGAARTALLAAAYLGVSGVFFVVKFAVYERVVFVPSTRS